MPKEGKRSVVETASIMATENEGRGALPLCAELLITLTVPTLVNCSLKSAT